MLPNVLINLLNAYCCSFYGAQLCKFNSSGFDKICKSWNIAVILILVYHTIHAIIYYVRLWDKLVYVNNKCSL